jgi:hypothetical protein
MSSQWTLRMCMNISSSIVWEKIARKKLNQKNVCNLIEILIAQIICEKEKAHQSIKEWRNNWAKKENIWYLSECEGRKKNKQGTRS